MDPSIPKFPGHLNAKQKIELRKLENCLYHKNVVEHCKVSPLEIIDARGALHAYYHWPKTLAQHLAAKLLLSWAWIYLVRFNFWYIIINDDDAPTKRHACFYDINEDEILSYDLDRWQEITQKLINRRVFSKNETTIQKIKDWAEWEREQFQSKKYVIQYLNYY